MHGALLEWPHRNNRHCDEGLVRWYRWLGLNRPSFRLTVHPRKINCDFKNFATAQAIIDSCTGFTIRSDITVLAGELVASRELSTIDRPTIDIDL